MGHLDWESSTLTKEQIFLTAYFEEIISFRREKQCNIIQYYRI